MTLNGRVDVVLFKSATGLQTSRAKEVPMTMFVFVVMAVLMFACIMAFVRGWFWIMRKGSPASQLIIAAASMVFCLLMAYCNSDQSRVMMYAFLLSTPAYFWVAARAFNRMVPTKEQV